jgi:hypothetical protein
MNAYDSLYTNMKNRFTVVKDNVEYTLGDYMLMKADAKSQCSSNLPAVHSYGNKNAVSAFFRYVNEKLTVKTPPVKDKTIRAFPFRTSAAALLSAVVACTLMLTFGSIVLKNSMGSVQSTVDTSASEQTTEEDGDGRFTYKQ